MTRFALTFTIPLSLCHSTATRVVFLEQMLCVARPCLSLTTFLRHSFKECGVKTSLNGQVHCLMKTHLEFASLEKTYFLINFLCKFMFCNIALYIICANFICCCDKYLALFTTKITIFFSFLRTLLTGT